ncbi:MAG: hypothetical protein ABT15_32620 [Pseudonocardia sp. SCN 73-27]|nr:MAG: hypothetical protein ABT15_32620 [Pseudonocardia sp. SCN 73-27]
MAARRRKPQARRPAAGDRIVMRPTVSPPEIGLWTDRPNSIEPQTRRLHDVRRLTSRRQPVRQPMIHRPTVWRLTV